MDIFDGLDNFKNPNQRDYCLSVVFGNLGGGKSTFLKQFATAYVKKTSTKEVPRKVLICDPSEARGFSEFPEVTLEQIKYGIVTPGGGQTQPWKSGIMVLRKVPKNWGDAEWLTVINRHFKNGLIIFDESKVYIPRDGKRPAPVVEFFTKHRNWCVDAVVVSHDYMSLNVDMRKQFRYYFCFKTGDMPTDVSWFEQRTPPTELYAVSKMIKLFECDEAKMQPMIAFDAKTGKKNLYIHPASEAAVKMWVSDGKGSKKLVPYLQVKLKIGI